MTPKTNLNTCVELRYLVSDPVKLRNFLKTGVYVTTQDLEDIYYDFKDFLLLRKGIFIRSRNQNILQIKFSLDDLLGDKIGPHEAAETYTFLLPFVFEERKKLQSILSILDLVSPIRPTLPTFLKINHLEAYVKTKKKREIYVKDSSIFHLDAIEKLEPILEITQQINGQEEVSSTKAEMEQLVATLHLEKTILGPLEIYLRKYQPEIYQLGKYKVE
ncbi:hypothetical protein COT40_02385 [Candidatus Peregrinibacteria bacterium CG08_land_8_20_14_0_20_41_10]|nr:MAG: hypothetical protein COT40_02385 [Candidatus Peregrinibacteria bacterium CG08_land_8_20_14_0_20_41_10]